MQTLYSEDDTERAREQERSSAGKDTQRLEFPEPTSIHVGQIPAAPTIPATQASKPNWLGLLMIATGVLMLVGQMLPSADELEGGMVLLTIASCFLFFSFWKRFYALIIPGCILVGLSLGIPFADLTDGASVVWGLSLGFASIMLVGKSIFNVNHQWPIFPAVILFAVGIIIIATSAPSIMLGGLIWLPILLIGAGLFFGMKRPS